MVIPLINKDTLRHAIHLADDTFSHAVVDRALRTAGLSRRLLNGSTGFLPLALEAKFAEALARSTGERQIGYLIGKKFKHADLGWYADYVVSAPELAGALERCRQAISVIHPGCSFNARDAETHVVLNIDMKIKHVNGVQHIQETAVFLLLDLVRHYLGSTWSPDWVEISARPLKASTLPEEFLSSTIHYGTDLCGIALRKNDLYAKNTNSPEASVSLRLADIPRLMGVAPPKTLTDEVQIILQMQLAKGYQSVDAVAATFGLSVRSLQRKLQAEGTSFREVSQQFLKERAITLMARSDLTMSEVARLLGYQEPNSFSRAFLEWTGSRPTEFRKSDK
jgi:AraC-like DNA-binding protein